MTELAGAFFTQFILNPRLLYPAEILHQWRPGLDVRGVGLYNGLDFWISFGMGKSFSFAFVGMAASIPMVIKFKQARQDQTEVGRSLRAPPPGRGDFPLWLMAILWLFGMGTFIYIVHVYMAPNFPLIFLLGFAFLYTPVNSYITARTYGILGRDLFEIPYLHETTFILSRYEEIDIWFVPLPDEDYGRGTQSWRVLELTGTTFTSSIAARLLIMPILIISGIVVWHFIWKVAPIPSAQYPFAQTWWPHLCDQRMPLENLTSRWKQPDVASHSWQLCGCRFHLVIGNLRSTLGSEDAKHVVLRNCGWDWCRSGHDASKSGGGNCRSILYDQEIRV